MFENLIAQPASSLLTDDIRSSRLPPSMLFYGQTASGKLTAALETARVLSTCGRILSGTLVAENPPFTHSFGPQIPEFIGLGDSLRSLWGNQDE